MTSRSFNCSVCGGGSASEVVRMAKYPAYLVPLPERLAKDVVRPPLVLAGCNDCGHLQLTDVDPEVQRLIYEVYYSHYVVDSSEALIPHYRKPFDEFVARLAVAKQLPRGRLLEIGCSSGERVPLFERHCLSYTGIDPSERIEEAKKRHPAHEFIKGYFPKALPGKRYDVVATQFNLEHLADPSGFVAAIREHSGPDTVILIQIPDVNFFQRTGQPNFLAHEHLHYFRRPQLERMLQRHSFEAFAWGEEGPSLICAARRVDRAKLPETPTPDPLAWARRQQELFDARPALPSEPLIFYGVGPLLYWLFLDVKDGRPVYVVDDNPKYEGQALPGYGHPILRMSRELLEKAPNVFLSLNVIYHKAVLDKLRAFGVPLTVHAIDGGVWSTTSL